MSNEIIDKNYIDIKEVCELLNVSKPIALEMLKSCLDFKEIEANGGSKKKLYNKQEVLNINSVKQQQQQLYTLDNQATKLAGNKNIEVIANAFMKSIDNIDLNDKENFDKLMISQMYMLQKTINKLNERIENKEKEKEVLQNWKEEKIKIENEKYKAKELRTKINKTIRKYCYNNNVNYSDFMIKLYKLYDNIHCFSFKENYKEYIDIIQERGHLKEFYNIVLNNI